jgi:hypothetical protein
MCYFHRSYASLVWKFITCTKKTGTHPAEICNPLFHHFFPNVYALEQVKLHTLLTYVTGTTFFQIYLGSIFSPFVFVTTGLLVSAQSRVLRTERPIYLRPALLR